MALYEWTGSDTCYDIVPVYARMVSTNPDVDGPEDENPGCQSDRRAPPAVRADLTD
jgi:hypothetical protein